MIAAAAGGVVVAGVVLAGADVAAVAFAGASDGAVLVDGAGAGLATGDAVPVAPFLPFFLPEAVAEPVAGGGGTGAGAVEAGAAAETAGPAGAVVGAEPATCDEVAAGAVAGCASVPVWLGVQVIGGASLNLRGV